MRKLWDRIWAANPYVVDGAIAAFLFLTSLGTLLADEQAARRDPDALSVLLLAAITAPIA